MGSYFLGPFFFFFFFFFFFNFISSGDHFLDPSHLAEDGLRDNNPVDANLGADSLDDSESCYFLAYFVALPK
jgi:hypothetical protein